VVVIFGGASKPEGEQMHAREYERIRAYRDVYNAANPRPVAVPLGLERWYPAVKR